MTCMLRAQVTAFNQRKKNRYGNWTAPVLLSLLLFFISETAFTALRLRRYRRLWRTRRLWRVRRFWGTWRLRWAWWHHRPQPFSLPWIKGPEHRKPPAGIHHSPRALRNRKKAFIPAVSIAVIIIGIMIAAVISFTSVIALIAHTAVVIIKRYGIAHALFLLL